MYINKRVLFVDDEITNCQNFVAAFAEDFEITTATSPKEGLRIIEEAGAFSVIVVDYKMPEMNGLEFLKQAQAKSPQTLKILITAYADTHILEKALNQCNIYRYLSKPTEFPELKIAIEQAIEVFNLKLHKEMLLASLSEANRLLEELVDNRTRHLQEEIEKRKAIENKIREKQRILNNCYRQKLIGIAILDNNFQWLKVNQRFLQILGVKKDEIQHKTIFDFFKEDIIAPLNSFLNTNKIKFYQKEYTIEVNKRKKYLYVSIQKRYLKNGKLKYVVIFIQNITHQKKIKRIIKKKNLYLNNLIDNANLLILGYDKNGKILIFNQEAEKITGYTKKEAVGKSIFNLLIPFSEKFYMQQILDEFRKNQTIIRDSLHIIKTRWGKLRYISCRNNVLEGPQKALGIISFGLDITEQINAENKLKEAQLLAKVCHFDIDLTCNQWNLSNSLFELYPISEKKLLGRKDLCSLIDYIEPESRTQFLDYLQEAYSNQNTYIEHELKLNIEKNIYWIRLTTKLLYNELGKIVQITGALQDITERKKQEELLKKAYTELQNFSEAIMNSALLTITDTKGVIIKVNNNFCKVSGYEPWELIGKKHSVIKSGLHTKSFFTNLWKTITQGKIWSGEICNKAKDGSLFWLQTFINPIYNQDKKLIGFLAIRYPTTEKKKAEAERDKLIEKLNRYKEQLETKIQERTKEILHQKAIIEKNNKQLKELNLNKDRFFSIIAHDLRSPFTHLEMLIQSFAPRSQALGIPELNDFMNNLQSEAQKVQKLLEDLLNWSRIQLNKITYAPEFALIAPLVEQVVAIKKEKAREKNIQIQTEIEPELEAFVDVNMFKTILRNLLSNAIKFSFPNQSISLRAYSLPGDEEIEIQVIDKGVGMSKDIQQKLFKIEELLTTPGTMNETGTGLGLLIVKHFVEINQGNIAIESELGKGTTVSIRFPK
jgi:PAS domain S-box-containing protein